MVVDTKPWYEKGLKFQCTGCGKCCTGKDGYVYLSAKDIQNLSKRFQISSKEFTQKYTRFVDGAYALLDRKGSADCIFLQNQKCSVYEDRPSQCQTFPFWTDHLRTEKTWEELATLCEGVNHEEAPIIPFKVIEEQYQTYLDQFIEQHFDF